MLISTLVLSLFTLTLASCSKDDEGDKNSPEVVSPETNAAVRYYAVSDKEGIAFTAKGIADEVKGSDSPKWVLTYGEIARWLKIDSENIHSIHITRDQILDNGLWRFDVSFAGQAEGTAYAIDVDITDGNIEWSQSIEAMPGGDVFVLDIK